MQNNPQETSKPQVAQSKPEKLELDDFLSVVKKPVPPTTNGVDFRKYYV